MPWPSLATSTTASSCLANAWIRLVPSPPLLSLAFTSGLPTPLSEIVSFQSVSATLYETAIAASGFAAGNVAFHLEAHVSGGADATARFGIAAAAGLH